MASSPRILPFEHLPQVRLGFVVAQRREPCPDSPEVAVSEGKDEPLSRLVVALRVRESGNERVRPVLVGFLYLNQAQAIAAAAGNQHTPDQPPFLAGELERNFLQNKTLHTGFTACPSCRTERTSLHTDIDTPVLRQPGDFLLAALPQRPTPPVFPRCAHWFNHIAARNRRRVRSRRMKGSPQSHNPARTARPQSLS